MALWGLNSPRATNVPSWLGTTTSSPTAAVPSTRAIEPANSQGCRAKNGRARRGLRMTRAPIDVMARDRLMGPARRLDLGQVGEGSIELVLVMADAEQTLDPAEQ